MFKVKFSEFEEEFVTLWAEYVKLGHEFDLYRGRELTQDEIDACNDIMVAIQETFVQLYPAILFVVQRTQDCAMLIKNYERFVEDIKRSGATEVRDEVN
jgi:hypothetical protein